MRRNLELNITPCGVRQLANGEAALAGEAAVCHNLREIQGGLQPVGKPTVVGQIGAGERLLAVDGDRYISSQGQQVLWAGQVIATATGTVNRATVVGDFVVLAVEGGDPIVLHRTSTGYDRLDRGQLLPGLQLWAAAAGTVTASIPAHELSTPLGRWQYPLPDADVAAIAALMKQACSTMSSSAASDSRLLGAALVRYGVRLWDDSIAALSAPVLLTGSTLAANHRVTTAATTADGSFTGFEACTLSATAWRLGIAVTRGIADSWKPLVKSVDVWATPVALPWQAGTLDYRMATTTTGTRRYLLELGPATRPLGSIVQQLLAAPWQLVASTTQLHALDNGSFDALNVETGGTAPFPGTTPHLVVASCGSTERLQAGQVAAIHGSMSKVHRPACMAQHLGRLHQAGGSLRLAMPWSAAAWCSASQVAAQPCTLTTIVTVSTGQGTATLVGSEQCAFTPTALTPLLAVPHPRATSLQVVAVDASGAVASATMPLMPLHHCAMAAGTGTGLADIALQPTTEMPSACAAGDVAAAPGLLGSSVAGNPLVTEHQSSVTGASIVALSVAIGAIYSGSYGRYPLYCFTTQGVYALPLGANGAYGEGRLVSRRVIDGAISPAEAEDCTYFVADTGQLCKVAGSKVQVVLDNCQATALAWDGAHGTLVMATPSGCMVCNHASGRTATRDLGATQLWADGTRALAVDPQGQIADLQREQPAQQVSVRWQSHPIVLDSNLARRVRLVTWNTFGAVSSLRMALNAACGNASSTVAAFTATGTLDAPLPMPVAALPQRAISLEVEGQIGAETVLRFTSIKA